MAGMTGELCAQIPSQLEGRILIFSVGPYGAGAVAPAESDMLNVVHHMSEASNWVAVDPTKLVEEVKNYLKNADPDQNPDAVLTYNRALACAAWLAFNAKPPQAPYRWIAFGLLGDDFTLAAGHDDETYIAARNMLIQQGAMIYAPHAMGIVTEPGSHTLH